ncbi:MAG TPA: T9SS type A sorting domain-containing protein [Rhodothermales bacterium]|nr:T9SS type A sorting domain-containing protein [Rhodothermales bacterium]
MKRALYIFCLVFLLGGATALSSQAQSKKTPSSLLKYAGPQDDEFVEGDGYMVSGDAWETVKPFNTNEEALLRSPYRGIGGGMLPYMHLGANDNNFFNPGGMWPNAYRIVNLFRNARKIGFSTFKPGGWPGYAAGNPIFDLDNNEDSRFMVAVYGPNVAGANDPARNYQRPARYVDNSRGHLIYEAGWPTTAGIDFKLRAHQYTNNEQNMNDFVVLEFTLTNTGEADTNGDGTIDASNNVIEAIAASLQGETAPAIKIGFGGERLRGPDGGSKFGAGRSFGYVGAPDHNGNPYDFLAFYANVPPQAFGTVPPTGQRDFGINNYRNKDGYTDVWGGWRWMGAKQGSITDFDGTYASLGTINASSPDKQTLFGTHPTGQGAQRGWYTSHTYAPELVTYRWNDSAKEFRAATAVWYDDYGRVADGGATPVNLAPNPRFFSGGTMDDVTTFVPAASPMRPNGDFKYASEDVSKAAGIQQPVWEPEWNPALQGNSSPSGTDFYQAVGYVRDWTFGESNKTGMGPFRLEVGESITLTFVAMSGFRLEGISDAADAAQWAWEKGWDIRSDLPTPPAPEMIVESTTNGTAQISWTDVSNISNISGYKVWRAAQYKQREWLEEGMRLMDNFHHQQQVGSEVTPFLEPINPYFDAQETAFTGGQAGTYQPEEWGTYDLIAVIPNGELGQYQASGGPYDYAFEDADAITGFTYWYYVSSYQEGSFTGPQGPVGVNFVESSGVVNRNGRNTRDAAVGTIGMVSPWGGTYPFAWNNPNYPDKGTLEFKNLGAEFTVTPPVADVADVADIVTVSPNPYKITGLNDVRSNSSSHNINFLNVPAEFALTIIDVSGQIIFQDNVQAGADGRYVWDLFSKDGVEIASGLYIYHIVYGNDQEVTGHFAILR